SLWRARLEQSRSGQRLSISSRGKGKTWSQKSRKTKGARRFLFYVLCRARRQLLGNRVLREPAQSRLAGTCCLSLENQAHGKGLSWPRLYPSVNDAWNH